MGEKGECDWLKEKSVIDLQQKPQPTLQEDFKLAYSSEVFPAEVRGSAFMHCVSQSTKVDYLGKLLP